MLARWMHHLIFLAWNFPNCTLIQNMGQQLTRSFCWCKDFWLHTETSLSSPLPCPQGHTQPKNVRESSAGSHSRPTQLLRHSVLTAVNLMPMESPQGGYGASLGEQKSAQIFFFICGRGMCFCDQHNMLNQPLSSLTHLILFLTKFLLNLPNETNCQ